jgi:hypothetical protein
VSAASDGRITAASSAKAARSRDSFMINLSDLVSGRSTIGVAAHEGLLQTAAF